jgi:hypothetical protein
MSNRACIVALALLVASPAAHAFTFGAGTVASSASSSVDHAKYGARVQLGLWEKGKHPVFLSADLLMSSFVTVNPGAVASSSAPDQEEKKTGGNPFLARALLGFPMRLLGAEVSFGALWYYSDFANRSAAGVPNAPAADLSWHLGSGALSAALRISLGVNPLGRFALIQVPECSFRWMITGGVGLEAAGRAVMVESWYAGSRVSFVQPELALTVLAVSN